MQPSQTPGAQQGRQSNAPNSIAQIEQLLKSVRDQARQDLDTTQNPKVQALLETTAEVVQGLIKAYEDFEKGQEKAWQ
ncbi:MAG TPA: hypothetical protein VF120_04480 [Ktedonobacterales bacterium]